MDLYIKINTNSLFTRNALDGMERDYRQAVSKYCTNLKQNAKRALTDTDFYDDLVLIKNGKASLEEIAWTYELPVIFIKYCLKYGI